MPLQKYHNMYFQIRMNRGQRPALATANAKCAAEPESERRTDKTRPGSKRTLQCRYAKTKAGSD